MPRLTRFKKRLTGATVLAVDTRGKAMLTCFDNALTLYSHNQLYGRWYTMRKPRLPKTTRQLRVGLHTETHSALLYGASDIELLTERDLKTHPFLCRVGPDILDPDLTVDDIVDRLQSVTFRNRALGGLYLDQSALVALDMSYQQYRFQAFGREGLDCYACGATIERHTMGSRHLFVCPGCQQGLKRIAGNSTT
jgi:endonuclease-8